MIEDYFKYIILIVPFFFVYIPSQFFPVNNAGSTVPFRPPPITFAIVWPILLLLVGISWVKRLNLSLLYLILCILLGIWTIIYNFSKFSAFIEILFTLLFTLFLFFYKYDLISSLLLIPLCIWLSFASVLNGYEVFSY